MDERRSHSRAPGIARALAVLVLLAGIVAMHSAVFSTGHAEHSAPAHHAELTQDAATPAPVDTDCGAAGCTEHAGIHGCVFVLAALAAALTLILLYRLGDGAAIVRSAQLIWRGRRERSPPWTVLTLSQLAILRI
ncbi:DUF6153 family protein [Nocardia sp. NPDC056064]|uniref:DUF6153 family protein n=1 Tax=Nocardia sp. NPDC056064 TaxID=3345701 RepID=UPI0035E1B391